MLKAKAKAAATAAKQKKLAAERAAAAEAQQAQASQAIPNPVVGTRSGPGGRPSVTQYWVDNQSSMLASGGGIQRIGYDQAAFEDGVRNVILDPEPASFDKTAAGEGEEGEEATTTKTTAAAVTEEKGVVGAKQKEPEAQVDQDLVAILTKEFDLTPKAAMALLQKHQNDLPSTIEALLTPRSHPSAPSGRPASKLVSVSN